VLLEQRQQPTLSVQLVYELVALLEEFAVDQVHDVLLLHKGAFL